MYITIYDLHHNHFDGKLKMNPRQMYRYIDWISISGKLNFAVLFVAQIFALLPVAGIRQSHPAGLKFDWRSLPFVWTCVFLVCGTVKTLLLLSSLRKVGINSSNIGISASFCWLSHLPFFTINIHFYFTVGLVFFSCGIFASTLFLLLAKRWRNLMIMWAHFEAVFLALPYKKNRWSLAMKVRLMSLCIMFLAICKCGKLSLYHSVA